MASKRQRAFALFGALLFLVSSLAFSGLVIYQMTQQNKKSNTQSQTSTSKGKKMDNFTPIASVSELQKIDTTVGSGDEAKQGDTVIVDYVLALAKDGTVVQSSKDSGQPVTLQISQGSVIDGWVQGLPGMKVGGKRRLVIPANLAYGPQSPDPSIPANSDLVFDIDLLQIQPPQQ